jgi:hypothetical protein
MSRSSKGKGLSDERGRLGGGAEERVTLLWAVHHLLADDSECGPVRAVRFAR